MSDVDANRHGYPRPQLVRERWTSLDGEWDFALDPDGRWRRPRDVAWSDRIVVPFAPETEASGVAATGFFRACWYRRVLDEPPPEPGLRTILHFGAVDHAATVWIDGRSVCRHEGGYTPFAVDVTTHVAGRGPHELAVRADDDPHDLAKPRGKQDWQLEPHAIWYPRTTGIWQTVWLEHVPERHVAELSLRPDLTRWEVRLEATVAGGGADELELHVALRANGRELARDRYSVVDGEVLRGIALSDPGIDDFRNELLWRPARPTLIDVELELRERDGAVVDRVRSYTALRSCGVDRDRFSLNGKPYYLRLVLDQGYWPETGLTPPDDDALRRDVELAKAMGFNGVRKHQKLEDPRYLYWADRLGLLVWVEMPSAYRFTRRAIARLTSEWSAAIARYRNHPCVIAWVPFNESWGVPDLPLVKARRHYVSALYHLTKTLDDELPVIGNDGWEAVATDIIGIHDYDSDPEAVRSRYTVDDAIPQLLARERPGGRILVVEGHAPGDAPIVLSEFGGIVLAPEGQSTHGYSDAADEADLARRYGALLDAVHSCSMFAGFCYTQFADTYQEANGLLRSDRTPKFPLDEIARATFGPVHPFAQWRELGFGPPDPGDDARARQRGRTARTQIVISPSGDSED